MQPIPQIRFDDGPHPRAQLGFLAVANADLTERDMFMMKPDGVGAHFSRVAMPTQCTMDSLKAMGDHIVDAVSVLMPGRTDLDVICYNCTAGSFAIGEERIMELIRQTNPKVQATTLLTGVMAAFEALNIKRVAVGTPYNQEISELEAVYLSERGVDVTNLQYLSLCTDMEMNRVSPSFIRDFALAIDTPDADAVFMSCGALRSIEVIEAVEDALGKPFICSNQAALWHCLKLVGETNLPDGFGRLFNV